jgi:hypothetical protein
MTPIWIGLLSVSYGVTGLGCSGGRSKVIWVSCHPGWAFDESRLAVAGKPSIVMMLPFWVSPRPVPVSVMDVASSPMAG